MMQMSLTKLYRFSWILTLLTQKTFCQELPCVKPERGELVSGIGIENGKCIPVDNSFFKGIEPSPTSSNGLQAGAPVDIVLRLSQSGGNITTSAQQSQPWRPGFKLPPGGRIILDFSKEFQYSGGPGENSRTLNSWIDLEIADGNRIFGGQECFARRNASAATVCGNWTSSFGENMNQVVISSLGNKSLTGDRANEIGIKAIHIRPALGLLEDSLLYRMPHKECTPLKETTRHYCSEASDCERGSSCSNLDDAEILPSITLKVFDADRKLLHEVTHTAVMSRSPDYAIFSTNAGLVTHTDLIESVDWQEAPAATVLEAALSPRDSFLSGAPYAPRFVLFIPNDSGKAFPHALAQDVAVEIFSDTKGIITHGGVPIASIELQQPKEGGGALVAEGAGVLDQSTDFGGTLLVVPIKTGRLRGTYAVKIVLNNGQAAVSRTVVEQSAPDSGSISKGMVVSLATIVASFLLS